MNQVQSILTETGASLDAQTGVDVVVEAEAGVTTGTGGVEATRGVP